MTDLILIRHGETDHNRALRFQGHVDVPLNATGHAQAQRLAGRLAAEAQRGDGIAQLVCSDLQRARQTAAPAVALLVDLVVQYGDGSDSDSAAPLLRYDAALREQGFGVAEGLQAADLQRDHAAAWAGWLRFDPDHALPGGESARAFQARALDALWRIAADHPQRTVVVVTHGGVLDLVWRRANGLALHGPRQSDIPNAAFNRVRFAPGGGAAAFDGGTVTVLDWADVRHLQGLPPSPVYDQRGLAEAVAAGATDAAAGGIRVGVSIGTDAEADISAGTGTGIGDR